MHRSIHITAQLPARQTGAVLVVALIMLLALTLIGVSGLSSTTMEERMAGNMRDINTAFQAAEAALREGENFLTAAALPEFNNTNGLYKPAPAYTPERWLSTSWAASSSTSRAYSGTIADLSAAPRYIIEELPSVSPAPGASLASDYVPPDSGMYRVTARAQGGSDTTVVMLQSTYKR